MSDALFIPAKTAEMMNGHHVKGNRHAAMLTIAVPLIGNGMAPEAVFAQLRAQFNDADKSDKEIRDVVQWAVDKNPTPSGFGDRPAIASQPRRLPPALPGAPAPPKRTPQEAVAHCVGDRWLSEASWAARCAAPIPALPIDQARALFLALYEPGDRINIVGKHFVGEDGKAKPHGGGKSLTRDEWLGYFSENGLPKSPAGIWVRPNPCGQGTGKGGSIQDADILAFRFTLLESDILSVAEQLSFFGRTGLPIAAILTSGAGSCHAWVRVDATTLDEYRAKVSALYAVLDGYGMDKANKNASRLSRLTGAHRTIGGTGDGIQRLLYLDGECRGTDLTEAKLAAMAEALRHPPPSVEPLKAAVFAAADRYDDIIKNRGKTGVMTGIGSFDEMSGGLKKKKMYIVAAESKCGKSTLCLNIINHAAIKNGLPVALFSLEMDRDEIVDLLVSMNGSVNRNVFNTGDFRKDDLQNATRAMGKIYPAPLYIFDNPSQTVEMIREETMRLKAASALSLICVDYLQLVVPSAEFRDSREQQIAQIGRGLRQLASEADVPIIALSQINDDGKLRESRALGHDAHAVMILENMDATDLGENRELRFKIERARSMPKGEYPIVFETLFARMSEGTHKTRADPDADDARNCSKFKKKQHWNDR